MDPCVEGGAVRETERWRRVQGVGAKVAGRRKVKVEGRRGTWVLASEARHSELNPCVESGGTQGRREKVREKVLGSARKGSQYWTLA